jgi:NAD(P)-dependent dehydrogenase (short-subunit alcohol dehydrogenase family)
MAKTWFITGSSTGFGRILAEKVLARGDRVAATLRKPEVLEGLKQQYGDSLWIAKLDVTDAAQTRQVTADAFKVFGSIDIIVSNAGYGYLGAVEEVSDEELRRVLETNLFGSMNVVRAALPHLRKQGHGHILQISAAGGQAPYPLFGAYITSKWGIEGFCENLAVETEPLGIRVTIIEPGATPTAFAKNIGFAPAMPEYADTPAGTTRHLLTSGAFVAPGSADKVVNQIIELVDSGKSPRRLTLGPDAYEDVHKALKGRLAELEAQKDVAYAVAAEKNT